MKNKYEVTIIFEGEGQDFEEAMARIKNDIATGKAQAEIAADDPHHVHMTFKEVQNG